MKPILDIPPDQKSLLLHLLQQFLPGVTVWAFGSRVRGSAHETSDFNLVLFSNAEQKQQVLDLDDALKESTLPFTVDLLIWGNITDRFKVNIQQQAVVLTRSLTPTGN